MSNELNMLPFPLEGSIKIGLSKLIKYIITFLTSKQYPRCLTSNPFRAVGSCRQNHKTCDQPTECDKTTLTSQCIHLYKNPTFIHTIISHFTSNITVFLLYLCSFYKDFRSRIFLLPHTSSSIVAESMVTKTKRYLCYVSQCAIHFCYIILY